MAEITPEVRRRLEAIREKAATGELSEEERRQVGEILNQLRAEQTVGERVAERAPGPPPPPTEVSQITGGIVSEPLLEMVGGTIGGTIGAGATAPTGPGVIAGSLVGGALGSGIGSATYDSLNEALRDLGMLERPEDGPQGFVESFLTTGSRAMQAGGEDILFAGGAQVVGAVGEQIIGKPLIGRLLGLRNPEAQEIQRLARAQGIDIGATTAGRGLGGRTARGFVNVMGMFPWISGPIRKGLQRQFANVDQRTANLLNNFAPNATLRGQLGIDMVEAAKTTRQEFVRVAGEMYDEVRMLSSIAGHPKIIPTNAPFQMGNQTINGIQGLAQKLVDEQKLGTLLTKDGVPINPPAGDPLGDYISQLANLEDMISIEQFKGLSDTLGETVRRLSKEGFDVSRVAQIRDAMEAGMADLRVTEIAGGDLIADALDRANRFYSEGIVKFQSPTAQRFGRVERNIFGPGPQVQGTISPDQAADVAINLRSANSVRDLRSLVGDDVMDSAARGFLGDAIEASRRDNGFIDSELLRTNLGLKGTRRV